MQKEKQGSKIGITGGIGAGKSIISEIFRVMGIPIYQADDRAKYLMNHDPYLIQKIIEIFGPNAYQDGVLNRKHLAKLVFDDAQILDKLNHLVHPKVKEDYLMWLDQHKDSSYTIKEAALLFETGSYKELDQTILVYAPLSIRINRVILRDEHRSKTEIEKIDNNQMNDIDKKQLADYIIYNDNKSLVLPQVLKIHQKLLKQSVKKH